MATKRTLQAVVRQNRPKNREAAQEWTRSLLALISLERLIGDETEAKKQFQRCDRGCMNLVSAEEWASIKAWACGAGANLAEACKFRKK